MPCRQRLGRFQRKPHDQEAGLVRPLAKGIDGNTGEEVQTPRFQFSLLCVHALFILGSADLLAVRVAGRDESATMSFESL